MIGNFSVYKNVKLNNISFTSKVKLWMKCGDDKHKIQHTGDLLGIEGTCLAGSSRGSAALGLIYFISWENMCYRCLLHDSLCLICTLHVFFGMQSMDSTVNYFKTTWRPDKTCLHRTSSPSPPVCDSCFMAQVTISPFHR